MSERLDIVFKNTGEPVANKLSRYPDGQVNVNIDDDLADRSVVIRSRMNSFNVLQEIAAAASALCQSSENLIELEIPYLLGARSDRRFGERGSDYLKDVICPFINCQGFDEVRYLDPHSEVMERLLIRGKRMNISPFYEWVASKIPAEVVISPDAGAESRSLEYWKHNPYSTLVKCSKSRDIATGKILETKIPADNFYGKDTVIIDDICDGGATFLNLGREIRHRKCGRLYLVVTHGVFSAGFHLLEGVFDHIYCTDSYKIVSHPLVSQFSIWGENE